VIGRLALGWCLLLAAQPPALPVTQRDAIRKEALAASAVAEPDRTAARAALHAVLSQPAFAQARATSWQDDLRRRVEAWLADLWDRTLGRRVGHRTAVGILAWGAPIAAVLVLLAWLTRLTVRRRLEGPLAIGVVQPPRASGRELGLRAAALIRAGQTRDAARVAYRAALQRLEEDGAFRLDDARTPREYLRLLPAPHRRRTGLSALTAAFERLWYGSRAPSRDDGATILALLQDLECLPRDHAN
jgi:uncharacterized protein (DUF1778 family)